MILDVGGAFSADGLVNLDTCKAEGLWRWFGTNECKDYCPTGMELGILPSICLSSSDREITTAVFTAITEFPMSWGSLDLSKGKFLGGLIDLGLDLIRGLDDPIFVPFRGLYFDGFDDFMRLVDIVLSGNASIGVVLRKPTGVNGTLFSFDTIQLIGDELALSFEGDGSELVVYNSGESAKFPTLSLGTDGWIVLGFSWSWSDGNMSFTAAIDDVSETVTINGIGPYIDTRFSTHYWGNSRITQFGLLRAFATFLEVYLHSIHIRAAPGLTTMFDDNAFRIPGLWICAWN